MSQCRKFVPNIFHQSKCSNCFRQLNEHTTEALECNRVTRSIARSGYLFVAPDWDFSVPLNRTKRWQRRWFVLYDDGQLNYSVDEHPDTIPQGSVDMTTVLEVTGAEQVTGHAHSLALTSPDRVTFVKAASREEARWWAELLAVFPRRPKRNATFPGGRVPPSLPQLGRSASPQPPRPLRHLSLPGPSPRTNFETPPLKEEIPPRNNEKKKDSNIDHTPVLTRKDYVISSGSPPTRDKLRCEEKMRVRRDWRHERFRNIATALTESPDKTESRLALPSEGLLHLKKGWLRLKSDENDWLRRWTVLCGPTLNVYRDQDENRPPELSIELSTVTGYAETSNAGAKHGFRIEWAGPALYFNALTRGIRSNWMQALKMALESMPQCSSDDEYRTASEGGRRESGDWTERLPRLPRCQSRHSTLNSTSTDELEALKAGNTGKWGRDVDRLNVDELKAYCAELQRNLDRAVKQVRSLKTELTKSEAAYDRLELTNHSLRASLDAAAHSHRAEVDLLAARLDHLTAKLHDKTRKRGRRKTDEAEVVRRSVAGVVDQLQRVLLAKLRTLDEEKRAGRLHPLHCLAEKMAFERVTLARIQQALDGPNSVAEKEAVETGHLICSLIDKLENHAPKTATQSKTSAEHLTKILTQHFLSLKQDRNLLRAVTVKQESPKLQWLLEQQRHLHSLYRDYFDKQIAFFSEESLNQARHLSTKIANRQLLETEVNRALSRAARTYRANYDSDVTFAFYASERAALELWSDSVASRLDREMAQARAALARVLPERDANDPEAVRQFADVVAHKALIDARIDVLTGRFQAELRLVAMRDEPGLVSAEAEAEFLCMFEQSPGNWDGNPQLSSMQN